jgi:hypothetical protein
MPVESVGLFGMEVPVTDKRVFIERRPGDGDYAVRKPGSERASVVTTTQREAIDWAKERGATPLVERVRETKGGRPDKWRKP